jgi:hypothetical protein
MALSISTIGMISLVPRTAAALPCCSAPICTVLHECHDGCLECALGDDDATVAQPVTDEADSLDDYVAGVCYLAEPGAPALPR